MVTNEPKSITLHLSPVMASQPKLLNLCDDEDPVLRHCVIIEFLDFPRLIIQAGKYENS